MPEAHPFAEYLRQAMDAVGLSTADLSRETGISDSLIWKWRAGTTQPSIDNLRILEPVLKVPMQHLLVVAGHLRANEVGLAEPPQPPAVSSIEDAIRADPHLSKRGKQVLLDLLPQLEERAEARRAEENDERPRRRRRPA